MSMGLFIMYIEMSFVQKVELGNKSYEQIFAQN